MEKNIHPDGWEKGEDLLRPDRYDLSSLLNACNEGRFEIFDGAKQKIILPVSRLKKVKRIFSNPASFCIPVLPRKSRVTTTRCYFICAVTKTWNEFFDLHADNFWQPFINNQESSIWQFNIPDALCSPDNLGKYKLQAGTRYELEFAEEFSEANWNHEYQVSGNEVEIPDASTQNLPFSVAQYCEKSTALIWFELLDGGQSVAWYLKMPEDPLSTEGEKIYRSFDSTTYFSKLTPDAALDSVASYSPVESDHLHALNDMKGRWSNSKSLNKCIQQIACDSGVDLESVRMTGVHYWRNLEKLRCLIMDTDYEYEPPPDTPTDKYEQFIFDEKIFTHRHYYFNRLLGEKKFKSYISSLLFRVNETIASVKYLPVSNHAQQYLHREAGKRAKNKIASSDINTPEKRLIKGEQLNYFIKKTVMLRRECLKLMVENEIPIQDLYYELRAKGVSRKAASRILYWPQNVLTLYRDDNSAFPDGFLYGASNEKSGTQEAGKNKTQKKKGHIDSIIKYPTNTLNAFSRRYELEYKKLSGESTKSQ